MPLLVLLAALAGCGSTGSSEATYEVWQDSCGHRQSFTRAEVIETWGAGAIVNGELHDGPAAINKQCAGK